jgi:hypothetical protein
MNSISFETWNLVSPVIPAAFLIAQTKVIDLPIIFAASLLLTRFSLIIPEFLRV